VSDERVMLLVLLAARADAQRVREYDAARSRRSRDVRPKVVHPDALKKDIRRHLVLLPLEDVRAANRPQTRADCVDGPRPCPWVSCRYHLYLDVALGEGRAVKGALRLNFPDADVDEIPETCALDVADRGGAQGEQLATLLNLTRRGAEKLGRRIEARLKRIVGSAKVYDDGRSERVRPGDHGKKQS
jgi:hypothetical protein